MLQSDGFGPAYRDLARRESVFARLITVYGRPDPFEWHDGGRTGSSQFAAMLLHIVGQQISAVAAFAIYDRISAATGGILAPAGVLGLGQDRLRACGLSAARARYALALAEACRPAAGPARAPVSRHDRRAGQQGTQGRGRPGHGFRQGQ
jgi:3-methyladenine DNA glycosylase/8-oxoguanine DNA glycosylase